MSLEVVATAMYSFSIIIWKWWYQKPGLKKSVLITYWQWFKLFAMVTCYFHGNFFVVSRSSGPRVFCSNNKLWCNCWISVCFEMLGPSALEWYWQQKTGSRYGYNGPFCSTWFLSGILIIKKHLCHISI